jgi:hypothetical protein
VYEVSGVWGERAGSSNIAMKTLPCPCLYCFSGDTAHAPCSNSHIVGDVKYFELEEIPPSECPVLLYEPLDASGKYTNEILKLFLRSHEVKLKGTQTKPTLIAAIRRDLGEFVVQLNEV